MTFDSNGVYIYPFQKRKNEKKKKRKRYHYPQLQIVQEDFVQCPPFCFYQSTPNVTVGPPATGFFKNKVKKERNLHASTFRRSQHCLFLKNKKKKTHTHLSLSLSLTRWLWSVVKALLCAWIERVLISFLQICYFYSIFAMLKLNPQLKIFSLENKSMDSGLVWFVLWYLRFSSLL